MKAKTLKNKINELILTGQTSFKGTKKGLITKWLSDETFEQLSDFLNCSKGATSTVLKRTSESSALITVYKDNDLIIIGTVNFY